MGGKAWTSKSLGAKFIFDSMKGRFSTYNFFKKFPSITKNIYLPNIGKYYF